MMEPATSFRNRSLVCSSQTDRMDSLAPSLCRKDLLKNQCKPCFSKNSSHFSSNYPLSCNDSLLVFNVSSSAYLYRRSIKNHDVSMKTVNLLNVIIGLLLTLSCGTRTLTLGELSVQTQIIGFIIGIAL